MVYFWTIVGRRLIWWDQLLLQDGNVKLMSMLGWMFLGVAAMGVVVITQKWYVQYWTKKRLLRCTCLGTVKLKSWAWMSNTCQSWLSFLSITVNLPAFYQVSSHFAWTHLYSWVTRGTVKYNYLKLPNNVIQVPGLGLNLNLWFRVQCNNHTVQRYNCQVYVTLLHKPRMCTCQVKKKCINACLIPANIQPKFYIPYVFGNVVNNLTQIWKIMLTR